MFLFTFGVSAHIVVLSTKVIKKWKMLGGPVTTHKSVTWNYFNFIFVNHNYAQTKIKKLFNINIIHFILSKF